MARPRTPTNVLQLRGAGKKHPERLREREDEPTPTAGIGPAPKSLRKKAEREVWDEIVVVCAPGVLGNSDRLALETLCRLVVQWREFPLEIPASRVNIMIGLMGRFGLTPADRSKIAVPKGKGKNAFEGL